ncbi:G-protein subunit alpha 10 [Cavenderia fasciculata]|uniref:G-protein subunit alpha 10 n=1 Tax=Cavenderia fasciculata TaxID=261658 RepID=F4PXI0_CACFS|nr:G-protein subunit alpha 10 [Cavenderia fasciculata]EGG19490.1 G-protein subunit alpha 10 [Cavenderia fasciculata]|eukprot:XP_004357784.1 G-protein subunit alpha 10 [Cavenderia fasciculata]
MMTNHVGCFTSSSEAKQKSKEIDKNIKKESTSNVLKLLLLGASDSGKSTLFKQMKIIQEDNGGFTKDELVACRGFVYENIISQMNVLLEEMYCDRNKLSTTTVSVESGTSGINNQPNTNDNLNNTNNFDYNGESSSHDSTVNMKLYINEQPQQQQQHQQPENTTDKKEILYFQDPSNFERAARVMQAYQLLLVNEFTSTWTPIIQDIKELWKSKEIQYQFNTREDGTKYFHLHDSTPYFLNNIDYYLNEDFLPTEQDVLRIRTKTTGVTEADYLFRGLRFKMVDVGGQKSYRRKWIHCFDNVSAVLFVASLNSYDQVLEEDGTTNRLQDSLSLFGETSNSTWFTNSTIVLFLNKSDLFREKIKRIPLSKYFPGYTGPNKAKDAATYIFNLFNSQFKQRRQLYFHITCAINTKDIKFVFQSVVDDLLKKSLQIY